MFPGNPLEEGTLANGVVNKCRVRKGLKVEVPALDTFYDKL